MTSLNLDQLASRKAQAVRFTRDVLGDVDRADEIEDESPEGYAERRGIEIVNPSRRRNAIMANGKTKAELEAEIADLREENDQLQDALDAIADIVGGDDSDDDTDDDNENGEDDDED
jgi:hypothetical protein